MTPEQALGILQFLRPQLLQELATTRRVLAAVPDDKGDYKPAPENMSALELATHIATVEVWFLESVLQGAFADAPPAAEIKTASDVVAFYESRVPRLIEKLTELDGETLAKGVQFYDWNLPNVVYLQFLQKHTIHHRGQLSVYLRPMGAKVPSIYGGSYDEPYQAASTSA